MNMIANKVYFKRSNMQRQLLLLDIAQIHQFYVWKDFLENLHPRERSVCERARDSGFSSDDDDDKKRQRQAKINFIFILPRSRPVALVHAINAHHDPSSYVETCKVNNAADKFC